jgi:hypothetical protein
MSRNETVSGGDSRKRRKQDEFITSLLSLSNVEAAASAVKISRATAFRWLRDPAIVERLRAARREAWSRALAQLQEAGPEAVEALRKILREAENEAPRVSAARTILELGLKSVEIGDITERLERLEQIAKTHGPWREPNHDRENQTPTGKNRGVNGPA